MEKKKETKMKAGVKFAIQVVVSCFGLWWVYYSLRDIDWLGSVQNFSEISWGLVAASTLLFCMTWGSRLFRLRLWVEKRSEAGLSGGSWIGLYLKSIALGAVTPARLGDFSRVTLLAGTGLSLGQRSKLVLLDKLSDLLYIPAGFCLTAWVVGLKFGISIFGLFLLGLVIMAGLVFVLSMFGRELGPGTLASGWLLTGLGLVIFIGANTLLFWAVGIDLSVQEVTAIILPVGVLAAMPVSFGGLGVREGSLLSLLTYWGVNDELITPLLLLEFCLNMVLPVLLFLGWEVLTRSMAGDDRQ